MFPEQLSSSKTKKPIHLQQHSRLLVLQAKHIAIQRPNSYLKLTKTSWYIMVTNHTHNFQQKNIPNGHQHVHMSLPQQHSLIPGRRVVHCKTRSSTNGSIQRSSPGCRNNCWTQLYEQQGHIPGLLAQFWHVLFNTNILYVNIIWYVSL